LHVLYVLYDPQVEQSQADRSRKKFFPIRLAFRGDQPMRVSVGRLHFAETTHNNMRKKGRPNPEQRWVLCTLVLRIRPLSKHGIWIQLP
jgi:hypothetical protein